MCTNMCLINALPQTTYVSSLSQNSRHSVLFLNMYTVYYLASVFRLVK